MLMTRNDDPKQVNLNETDLIFLKFKYERRQYNSDL